MKNWNIVASDFVVLRTPFLSEDTVDFIHEKSVGLGTQESIKTSLRELKKICSKKEIITAIEFASTSLAEKVHLLTDELSVDNLKLASSFYKYLIRMSTRCTPFGAFSSAMTLPIGNKTYININKKMRKYIRVDSSYVIKIANLMESEAIMTKNQNLMVRKNSSLYRMSDEFRLIVKNLNDKFNEFKLESAKYSDAINQALSLSHDWLTISDLTDQLKSFFPDTIKEQLSGFVFNLLKSQLLESNLTIVVSSKNALSELNTRAKSSKICPDITRILDKTLHDLDERYYSCDTELENNLIKVKQNLCALFPDEELTKWLHLDSFRDTETQAYGRGKIDPIVKTVHQLAGLLWEPPHEFLITFSQKFHERYEDASVPLLEALDVDTGIVFGQPRGGRSPLLEGFTPDNKIIAPTLDWKLYDEYLLNSIIEGIKSNEKTVTLNVNKVVELLKSRQKPTREFNSSVSIFGTYIDNKDSPLFQLKAFSGPSSLTLLGRFCCGDGKLLQKCKDIAEKEQQNNMDAIYAEIIHIPQADVANISCRPAIRDYEIVYGPGDSSLISDKQINCNDLYLKIFNGRLVLFSKKLNKEIRPRLASAHGLMGQNMPVYHFLHSLQSVDGMFNGLYINKVIRKLPYVPEIRIGNILLSPQKWGIKKEDINKLRMCKSIDEKLSQLNKIRENQNIARFIDLYEGDNFLEFDLDSNYSKLVFISELIKRNSLVKLYESLKGRTDKDIHNNCSVFRNEIILPCFINTLDQPKPFLKMHIKKHGLEQPKLHEMGIKETWLCMKLLFHIVFAVFIQA